MAENNDRVKETVEPTTAAPIQLPVEITGPSSQKSTDAQKDSDRSSAPNSSTDTSSGAQKDLNSFRESKCLVKRKDETRPSDWLSIGRACEKCVPLRERSLCFLGRFIECGAKTSPWERRQPAGFEVHASSKHRSRRLSIGGAPRYRL